MNDFKRITQDPTVMGGKPTIGGMRVTVATIVGLIGTGCTIEEVLADYPYLEREDVVEALRYAARFVTVRGTATGKMCTDEILALTRGEAKGEANLGN